MFGVAGGDDAFTATDLTFNSGDLLVDGSTTDADVLTITATADMTATALTVGIETINVNVDSLLAGGDTTFSFEAGDLKDAAVNFDVTADSSLVTDLDLNGARSATYTLSSEFTAADIGTDAGSDVVVNIATDTAVDVSTDGGTGNNVTVDGGSAFSVTMATSTATGDLTVTGETVDINSGGTGNAIDAAGALTVTASEAADVNVDAVAGAVTITAGTSINVDSTASAGVITLTAGTDVVTDSTVTGSSVVATADEEATVDVDLGDNGTVTVTAGNNVDVDAISTAGSVSDVTVVAGAPEDGGGLSTNIVTTDADGTVTVTSGDVTTVDAAAATTVIVDNSTATAGDDITLTDVSAAETLTVNSAGDITFTAAAAAVETMTLTVAEDTTIDQDPGGATTAAVTLNAVQTADTQTAVVYTAAAGDLALESLAFGGDLAVTLNADLDDLTVTGGLTVTNTNSVSATIQIASIAGVAASNLTNVSADVSIDLATDGAGVTFTLADTGEVFGISTNQTDALVFAAETSANTDNSVTVAATAAIAIEDTTFTDYATVTFDSSDGTITFNSGGATNDEIDGDQLATVVFVGDNAIDMSGAEFLNTATSPTAVTVNASDMTAAVTLDIAGGNAGEVETFVGGAGIDTVTIGADTNSGNGYSVTTSDGNDVLDVTLTNDTVTIDAGTGNDAVTLSGGTANVTLGTGNDTVIVTGATNLTVAGGSGVDTVRFDTSNGAIDMSSSTYSLASVEQLDLVGGGAVTLSGSVVTGSSIVLTESADTATQDLNILVDALTIDLSGFGVAGAWDADDIVTIDGSGNSFGLTLTGSAASDAITGGSRTDIIDGGAGDDVITGGAGADLLTGGEGADSITGGAGDDTIDLGATDGSADLVAFGAFATNGLDTIVNFETTVDHLNFDVVMTNVSNVVAVTDIAAGGGEADFIDNEVYVYADGATSNSTAADVITDYSDLAQVAAFLSDDLTANDSSGSNDTTTGDEAIFVVNDLVGGQSVVYHFKEAAGNTAASEDVIVASELTILATVTEDQSGALVAADII